MRTYNEGGPSGTRGFCADGQTLTKYIWEYLGNAMPADFEGESPPDENQPPTAPTSLRIITSN